MVGTVIVGVFLALMFLVSFSEWFFHLAVGVEELMPSGLDYYSRLAKWGLVGLLFMAMVFWILSMVYECPKGEKREGIFGYMDCTVYWEVRARSEGRDVGVLMEEVTKGVDQLN
jgi:hypothetical protein